MWAFKRVPSALTGFRIVVVGEMGPTDADTEERDDRNEGRRLIVCHNRRHACLHQTDHQSRRAAFPASCD